MHNQDILMQLMQNLQNGLSDAPDPPTPLPSPFDTLYKIRPMLPPREQKMIDLMIKFHEIRVLMDEIQNPVGD